MKNRVTLLLATVVAVSLLLPSCATILGGSKDASRVHNGTPPNAKVYYNGNYVGDAPTNVKVNKQCKKGQCYFEIKADGYETQKIEITRKISVGYTILDICTGVIWLGIDFATGNIYKPRPNKISYNLTPIAGYNPAKTYDFKNGDKVIFTKDKYENVEGEIVAVYPDRALIKFKRKPTMTEKAKGIKDEVEDQVEVPFVNIAKK
jgi:predicted small secreted protein